MNFININSEEEIKILANLASEIWHEYWTVILSIEQIDYMVDKFQSELAIKNQIEGERYVYNILEDNGNIIGYFGIAPKEDYLFLSKLYIKKEFRNCGCGRLAFNKTKQLAQQFNKKSIRLTVNKNNINTIKAYEKWGFKTIDAVVTDIGNGFVMDDYIMEFEL
ncbi:MAG: GNAT family N-acetyltransferase [Candidatus Gastranaerophilales bacterium]|nr:GNAT family N-acetyltransferase [Candidatus Gastranaerophilales bacterium]